MTLQDGKVSVLISRETNVLLPIDTSVAGSSKVGMADNELHYEAGGTPRYSHLTIRVQRKSVHYASCQKHP